MKNDLQKQVDDTNNRIRGEEDQIANLDAQGGKVRSDGERLKGEVKVHNTLKIYFILCICIIFPDASGRPISFFSYRPIPINADKSHFLIGRYR